MDIIYSVKRGQDFEELKYSLRSLCNIPHDKVFIVGGIPDAINKDNVVYIETQQNGSKWFNTRNNRYLACCNKELSDNFIYFNDDFYILQPISNPEEELNICFDTVDNVYNNFKERYGKDSLYMKGMLETKKALQMLGIENPLCYELHTPIIHNKYKYLEMINKYKYVLNDICLPHIRTFYSNLYVKNSKFLYQDVKALPHNDYTQFKCKKFLSSADAYFGIIKEYLHSLFPNKCKYEV